MDTAVDTDALISDGELMAQIQLGCHQSFAVLVKRHTDQFYRLALSTLGNASDADDVIQTVFIKLWQQPHSWRPSQSKFTTWFYRVVLNQCRDKLRQSKQPRPIIEQDEARLLQPSEQDHLEHKQLDDRNRQRLLSAIGNLNDSQKDAINLKIYCELSQRETAEVMGLSIKAVESLLVRAKKNLAKQFEESEINRADVLGLSHQASAEPARST